MLRESHDERLRKLKKRKFLPAASTGGGAYQGKARSGGAGCSVAQGRKIQRFVSDVQGASWRALAHSGRPGS